MSPHLDEDGSDNDSIQDGIYDQKNLDHDDDLSQPSQTEDDDTISIATAQTGLDTTDDTTANHIRKADVTMSIVHRLMSEQTLWKKGYKHRSGVLVEYLREFNGENIPVFRGTLVMENFSAEEIFAVIALRKLWDDWYLEGHLVENLNDTTSLTYMTMRAVAGIVKIRDFSLIEKLEYMENGEIWFASTSIVTPRVPKVSGRVRATLKVNAWVLQPIPGRKATKVYYILQTNVKTPFPKYAQKKILERRPLVLRVIENYLKNNGPPPIQGGTVYPTNANGGGVQATLGSYQKLNSSISQAHLITPGKRANKANVVTPSPSGSNSAPDNATSLLNERKIIPKIDDDTTMPRIDDDQSTSTVTAPVQVIKHKHRHTEANIIALVKLQTYSEQSDWTVFSNSTGTKIFTRPRSAGLPLLKGETEIRGGWQVDDVLAVIHNFGARKIWDERFESGEIVERFDNGDEVLMHVTQKGNWPVGSRDFSVSVLIHREGIPGQDGYKVIYLASSVQDDKIPVESKKVRADMGVSGWILKPEYLNGMTAFIHVTYIIDVDIKLDSVPSSILKAISTGIPSGASRVDDFLSTRGFPPYWNDLTNAGLYFDNEEFDAKTGEFKFSLSVNKENPLMVNNMKSVANLRWSKRMHPNGFDMTIAPIPPPESIILESIGGKGAENIKVTFDRGILGEQTYHFNIKRRGGNSRGTDILVNGKSIPVLSVAEKSLKSLSGSIKRVPVNYHANGSTYTENANGSPRTPPKDKFPIGEILIKKGNLPTTAVKNGNVISEVGNSSSELILNQRRVNSRSLGSASKQFFSESNKDANRMNINRSDTFGLKEVEKVEKEKEQEILKNYDSPKSKIISEEGRNQTMDHLVGRIPSNAILILGPDLYFNSKQLLVCLLGILVSYYFGKSSAIC